MSKDINLLVVRDKEKDKSKKGLKAVRITAVFSLIAVAVFSLILYYLNQKIYPQDLKNEYDSLLSNISTLHNREAKLAIINNRIENISEILGNRDKGKSASKREDYSNIISKFSDKIPDELKIESLKIDKKTIILSLSASSLKVIDEFINGIITLGAEKVISVLILDSLTANQESGTYSLSMTANL